MNVWSHTVGGGWVANSISHHLETIGKRCLLVFSGREASFQDFINGAGCRPPTVFCGCVLYSGCLKRSKRETCNVEFQER